MPYFMESPQLSSASSSASSDSGLSPDSPSLSNSWATPQVYLGLAKMRLDSCRGFEIADDQEFCPALSSPLMTHSKYDSNYIQSVASFHSSSNPVDYESGFNSAPMLAVSAKKTLQIIDPATGMPISRM